MRDPCQAELLRTPHVTAAAGWLWSPANPPESTDIHLPGKSMLFPSCTDAVRMWRTVAEAAHICQIWQAKIAPQASRNGHLICVYTPDFTDHAGVEAVAQQLDDLGLIQPRQRLYYKPDIFTYAGIYSQPRHPKGGASIYEYLPTERHMISTTGLDRARELLARSSRVARGQRSAQRGR